MPKPKEISLAHGGVLFLDELTEFSSAAMEVMRQPIETGHIMINRLQAMCVFPAGFMLVAAINPCRLYTFTDQTLYWQNQPTTDGSDRFEYRGASGQN